MGIIHFARSYSLKLLDELDTSIPRVDALRTTFRKISSKGCIWENSDSRLPFLLFLSKCARLLPNDRLIV